MGHQHPTRPVFLSATLIFLSASVWPCFASLDIQQTPCHFFQRHPPSPSNILRTAQPDRFESYFSDLLRYRAFFPHPSEYSPEPLIAWRQQLWKFPSLRGLLTSVAMHLFHAAQFYYLLPSLGDLWSSSTASTSPACDGRCPFLGVYTSGFHRVRL